MFARIVTKLVEFLINGTGDGARERGTRALLTSLGFVCIKLQTLRFFASLIEFLCFSSILNHFSHFLLQDEII